MINIEGNRVKYVAHVIDNVYYLCSDGTLYETNYDPITDNGMHYKYTSIWCMRDLVYIMHVKDIIEYD